MNINSEYTNERENLCSELEKTQTYNNNVPNKIGSSSFVIPFVFSRHLYTYLPAILRFQLPLSPFLALWASFLLVHLKKFHFSFMTRGQKKGVRLCTCYITVCKLILLCMQHILHSTPTLLRQDSSENIITIHIFCTISCALLSYINFFVFFVKQNLSYLFIYSLPPFASPRKNLYSCMGPARPRFLSSPNFLTFFTSFLLRYLFFVTFFLSLLLYYFKCMRVCIQGIHATITTKQDAFVDISWVLPGSYSHRQFHSLHYLGSLLFSLSFATLIPAATMMLMMSMTIVSSALD